MSSQSQDLPSTAELASIAGVESPISESTRRNPSPSEAIEFLAGKGLYTEAVRLLAHLLPKREAVWWAWISARRAPDAHPSPDESASLQATEKWLTQPTDENRRAAMVAAEKAQVGTPAGCSGLAAFLSGDSLAPPGAHPVPPGEHLAAKTVANAIILAAVSSAPEKSSETLHGFLNDGLKLAERIGLWQKRERN